MFEDLRAQWKALGFQYVLLDSRTGFTDVGGICTRHLPDAVVTMFRLDDQSLQGVEGVVESIRREKAMPRRKTPWHCTLLWLQFLILMTSIRSSPIVERSSATVSE